MGFRGPFTRWLIGSANFLVVMNTAVQGDVIAIASDHAGFSLKVILREDIERKGFRALDLGTDSLDPADYPKIAESLALTVASGPMVRIPDPWLENMWMIGLRKSWDHARLKEMDSYSCPWMRQPCDWCSQGSLI